MRPLPHFKGGRVIYICVTRIESWRDMCLRAVEMGALRRPMSDRLCHVSTGGHEVLWPSGRYPPHSRLWSWVDRMLLAEGVASGEIMPRERTDTDSIEVWSRLGLHHRRGMSSITALTRGGGGALVGSTCDLYF